MQVVAKADLAARERAAEDAVIHRVLGADQAAHARQVSDGVERRDRNRREYESVQHFNATEKNTRGGAAAAEAAADKAALDYTLAKEAAAGAAERAAKDAHRRAACDYQATLALHTSHEDKHALDGYYAAESDKEWGKRQAKWDQEAAARKRLTDETAAYQAVQVAERSAGARNSKYDDMMLAKWKEDNAKAEAKEVDAVRAKREADVATASLVSEAPNASPSPSPSPSPSAPRGARKAGVTWRFGSERTT